MSISVPSEEEAPGEEEGREKVRGKVGQIGETRSAGGRRNCDLESSFVVLERQ